MTTAKASQERIPSLLIRRAQRGEFSLIGALEFVAARRFLELPKQTGMTPEQLRETLSQSDLERSLTDHSLWLAQWGGEAAGFVAVHRYDESLYVRELDVIPRFGRRGIGRALMLRVVRQADDEGAECVFLRTFREVPWNAPFYRSLGFEEVPQEQWTPVMRELVSEEDRWGLKADKRLFMRLVLG